MTSHQRGYVEAFQSLNIVTALAMLAFGVMGLIMVGLAGDVVSLMETHQYLPLAVSMMAYAVIFASSGTRNPEYYHPAEWFIVVLTGIVMIAHAALAEFQQIVADLWPFGAIVVLFMMILTSAILAR